LCVREPPSFSRDNDGKLDQITYPSGTVVDYAYDAAGRLSSIDVTKGTTTTVVNNITYEPFGPAISWDYGNGLTADLPVDSDYRIESVTHGTMMDVGYLYDDADNILDFDDLLSPYDESFVYDDLSRLTDADGDYGIWTFQYDATGNRTYATQGLLSDTYSYVPGSNRLSTIVGDHPASYTYDANGNVIHDGTYDYFYGDDNRLYRIDDVGGTIATYTHNAHGERVKKDTGTVTYYHYDMSGRLLAELDGSGNTVREYVYLEDRPVAFLDGSTIYYIHGDHLGTPHVVTNGAQTVVWQARYKPFGEANVVVNTVDFNLRYPGQYFDAEIGLHYNYFRDYDPAIGRYLQSDPIGLAGGINTYAYANNNPLRFTDPDGLISIAACGNPANAAACAAAGITSRAGARAISRAILKPERKRGFWTCNARADCDDRIEGNCPEDPADRFAFGTGSAKNLGDARNQAKSNATHNLGCQPKHVSCKCTGPKGEQYSGGC